MDFLDLDRGFEVAAFRASARWMNIWPSFTV
eukprot:COSAG02_NODE_51883_length_311_cov_0.844340_1_plen_30_part_01